MLVGLFSDTHDRLEILPKVIQVFQDHQVGQMIHCGDWVAPFTMEYFDSIQKDWIVPIKSVFGNNEGDIKRILERNAKLKNPIEFAPKLVFEIKIESQQIAVFHGHDKIVLENLILSGKYDAVFHGHTHQARNEIIGNTLVLNPGSTSFARGSQITNHASVAIYDTSTNSAKIVNLTKD